MPNGVMLATGGFTLAWAMLNAVGMLRAYRRQERGAFGLLLALVIAIVTGITYMALKEEPPPGVAFAVVLGLAANAVALLWVELNIGNKGE